MSSIINEKPETELVAEIPQHNLGNTTRATWNFSLDDIRANTANYPNEAKDALINAFLWCINSAHPMAKPDFGHRVGASDNLLYKLYTGKYRDAKGTQLCPSDDLIRAINNFLDLERERFIAGETTFVMTPTAKKIATACDLARESQSIVFLWGPSHIGKTWALEYYAKANHSRTTYSRLEAASGLGGMVRRIASDVGISDKSNTANLVARIKNALTPESLLMLDECHLLAYTYRKGSFFSCMEVIREIQDKTKCGLLLCFTILDDVRAASQKELQQLWRRGVHKVPLPLMPTKDDIKAILKHNSLEFPASDLVITLPGATRDPGTGKKADFIDKPYEILRQLAKNEGLKAITERLRYARKLAARSGEKLTWNHVLDAHLRIQKQAEQEGEWR